MQAIQNYGLTAIALAAVTMLIVVSCEKRQPPQQIHLGASQWFQDGIPTNNDLQRLEYHRRATSFATQQPPWRPPARRWHFDPYAQPVYRSPYRPYYPYLKETRNVHGNNQ